MECKNNIQKITDVVKSEKFYYQKLQDKFKKFKDYQISEKDVNILIDNLNFKPFSFEEYLKNNFQFEEFIVIIGQIIATSDLNGYNKNEWNLYDDKRVLAKAGVRQNDWTKNLLKYKLENTYENLTDSIKNAIVYIENPENNLTQLSIKHKKLVAENLLKINYDESNYFEKLKEYFHDELEKHKLGNQKNLGLLISLFLYCEEVRNLWDDDILTDEMENNGEDEMPNDPKQTQPLNQILYGPPGTGKTYNTINKALEIIDGKVPEKREDAKQKFDDYVRAGQIEFVTFHQSYGYEEFVEGIKADLDSEEIKYKLETGIFQQLSRKAEQNYFEVENSKNKETILDINKLINDFANNIQTKIAEGQEVVLFENSNKTKALIGNIKRKSNGNLQSFITSGSVKDQSLTISVILRDYQDYLDGKIQKYTDVKPSFESQSSYHGNAIYYFELYRLLKEFYDKNNNSYVTKNENINLKNHILIIDEINRGNISKIFGELITLIESSKRIGADEALYVRLPYSNEQFGVPQNLYIIGTMNTADRSITLMDTALRRRFEFTEMMPDLEALNGLENVKGINIKSLLETINKRIEYLYDRDHTIGHAYFMSLKGINDEDKAKAELDNIFRNKIIPLLQEYFYDDWEKILMVLGEEGFIESKILNNDIFTYKSDDFLEEDKKSYTIKSHFDYSEFIKG
jgi:5-methylcytosine-specific restriction protein B